MEKVYVGNAKTGESQYGTYLKVSLSNEDLKTISMYANEKGYTTLFISKRKEPSQYGHTHTIAVAPPKTDVQQQQSQSAPTQGNPVNPFPNNTQTSDSGDTIPF